MSPRGLGLVFLMMAAVFALAGWLRPPLSADVLGSELSLNIGPSQDTAPEEFLHGTRHRRAASVGAALLVLLTASALLILVRPAYIGVASGMILCAAIAGNAIAALNHPALIELMDFEYEQRHQILTVLANADIPALSNPNNGRITGAEVPQGRVSAAPPEDSEWASPWRGWVYLCYGRWLVGWAVLGVLAGTPGRLRVRFVHTVLWTIVGFVLAGCVCYRRLNAEYHWQRATVLASHQDYSAARHELATAVALFPEFQRLGRTWILAGRIDWSEGRATAQETFFRAFQSARHDERAKAGALMDSLLAQEGREPAVRKQAARIFVQAGLFYYRYRYADPQAASSLDPDYPELPRPARILGINQEVPLLVAAEDAWHKAAELAPQSHDVPFYLGNVRARVERTRPEQVDAMMSMARDGLADRILDADFLAASGAAYFAAGEFGAARRRFSQSFDRFSLAKTINFQALHGLGGL
jgi:hypothetical protein